MVSNKSLVNLSCIEFQIAKLNLISLVWLAGYEKFALFLFLENFAELIRYLNKSIDLLAKNWSILDNVLETLDMQQHTLGYLYVLLAKYTVSKCSGSS